MVGVAHLLVGTLHLERVCHALCHVHNFFPTISFHSTSVKQCVHHLLQVSYQTTSKRLAGHYV